MFIIFIKYNLLEYYYSWNIYCYNYYFCHWLLTIHHSHYYYSVVRRSWDRRLVPKVIELLDHTVSMYNLVHVCVFCAQYFDPDFEGGIAYPDVESKLVGSVLHTILFYIVPCYALLYHSRLLYMLCYIIP